MINLHMISYFVNMSSLATFFALYINFLNVMFFSDMQDIFISIFKLDLASQTT